MYSKLPEKRYRDTLNFLKEVLPAPATVLDLGVRNPFSEIMEKNGYTVLNTKGEDLDEVPGIVKEFDVDAVTAFQIFEHLIAPFNVLKEIPCNKLIATVPLRLWFATAYKNDADVRDRHFHEFEDWQFDWLVQKAGWTILKRQKWTSPISKVGIRPLLRKFTPRYYAIYASKS